MAVKDKYVIGVDFGTDSVRAIMVNAMNGQEAASAVSHYSRWGKGLYCDPAYNQFRQHPLDYIESLEEVVKSCVKKAGAEIAAAVCGISLATTGSTPAAVDDKGLPLALKEEFKENPNAMFILWKDHTAINEADEINRAATGDHSDYLKYVGGVYSSEWYWAKLLHTLRADKNVKAACFTWVEHSDWIPFLLTGGNDARMIKRNVCAAGHKALWAEEFGGMPDKSFFESVDPVLLPFRERFGQSVYDAGQAAGTLSAEWSEKLGLSTNVVVGIGAIDAHVGAVGGKIKPFFLSKVIGTSTCDMMVVPQKEMEGKFIEGICGQVNGSILPGMIGLEAGQSAFGDIYHWFRELLIWPLKNMNSSATSEEDLINKLESEILKNLDHLASQLQVDMDSEFAIDWFNGRRSPDANPNLKGLIGGLTLASNAPRIYRALVEATCFGSKAIMESIENQGIEIQGVNAIGGIATRSGFVVQMMADVLNRPVHVSAVEQTVALGAAMFASVVCGIHETLDIAGPAIGRSGDSVVEPRKEMTGIYGERYEVYKRYGAMQG